MKRARTSNASELRLDETTSKIPSPEFQVDHNSDDSPETIRGNYNTMRLDKVAETADRMNCSHQQTASMVTATLASAGK